ncbi:aminopeptidase P family protein [Erysipelothrix sp. HDW6C]|uniref:M24 family metallopeptidase n=1 Tax=Erysipelothrix sp. HDW6C TaxID=2714930 RepID=UPI00140D53AC|nr:aminopeptidase P family protein [Erysipelothrix sp. HDW6C]QIK70516.1 aminopeptidase P family protein [Erysipelothrix sp. HDW6C]
MTRLQQLQETMTLNQLIISDEMMVKYFTGHHFHVGERMLALLVKKTGTPLLFLNSLFSAPHDIETVCFTDSDDAVQIIMDHLDAGTLGIDGNWPARFVIPFIKHYDIADASSELEQIRRIKDANEIEIMIAASHHNDRIMEEMKAIIRVGMTEKELAAIVLQKQSTAPLEGPSFEPIVVFSENIADPHGVPSDRVLKEGDAVLIDMGGFYKGYASDMTRVFFVGSNPEIEKIYDIVRRANEAAIAAVKPDIPLSDVDKAARDVITDAGYGPYFVHRTGHGIGIETHETLDVSAANATLIEPGMCFSIEPGIYIPGVGGVRIEDLVNVTNGGVNVMNAFPKEIQRL